jgi:hypothetical protein
MRRDEEMKELMELKAILNNLQCGSIPPDIQEQVLDLVTTCWGEFEGSGATEMEARKICRDGGPKDLTWDPPEFSFTIDRHGGTVMGSKRAERQTWTLNLQMLTATPGVSGYRQLRPNSPKFDVTPVAKDICEAVQRGPATPSDFVDRGIVEWRGNDEIRVKHADLVPNEGPNQTISGRRKRLRDKLQSEMKAIGWEQVSVHQWITFKRR